MPTERDWDFGVGYVLKEDRFTLDKAASTYTEDNPSAGAPDAQNRSELVPRSAGGAPADVVQVLSQEGGLVGGSSPATFVYRLSESGDWFGNEGAANPRGYKVLVTADGSAIAGTQKNRAITLPDDRVLVTFQAEDGTTPFGNTDVVAAGILDLNGSFSWVEVHGRNGTPSVAFYPVPVVLSSGRIVVFSWDVDEGSETVQIRMDYSDDNGATWALGRSACLPEPLDVSSAAWDPRRIVAVETEGGIGLWVHLVDNSSGPSDYRDVIRQYASRDLGHSFELVGFTNEDRDSERHQTGAAPVCMSLDGALFVAWIGVDTSSGSTATPIYGARVGNVYDSVFDGDDTLIVDSSQDHASSSGTPALFSDYDLAGCQDHEGPAYITSRLPGSTLFRMQVLYRSDDSGRSWGPVGISSKLGVDGSPWSRSEVGGVYIQDVAIAASGTGLVAFGRKVSPGAVRDDSLHAIRLGGPSTVTFPPFYRSDTALTQTSPEYVWVPYDLPEQSGFTAAPVASGTVTVTQADEYVEVETSTGQHYWSDVFTGGGSTATNGAFIERQFSVESGGSLTSLDAGMTIRTEDGTKSHQVSIRLTTTGFRVVDDNAAGATVGTDASGMTASTRYELRVAFEDGIVRTWFREWTWAGHTAWTAGPTGVVVAGPAGSNQVVCDWGAPVSGTATVRWYMGTATVDTMVGTGLADVAYTNPNDLRGQVWTPGLMALGDAGTLVAGTGATTRGDEIHLSGRSEEGVQQAGVGGPRQAHVSSGQATETYVYDLGAGAAAPVGSDILVLAEFGSNRGHVKVTGVNGAARTTLVDTSLSIGLDDLPFERIGDAVQAPASGASDVNTPLSALMEHAGSSFAINDSGTWYTREIERSTGGSWSVGAGRRETLFLEGVNGSEPTSGTGQIIPKDWAVLIDLRGESFEQIEIEYATPDASKPAPVGGKWQTGRRILGYLVPHFHQPSWGNRVSARGHAEVLRTPDRTRRGRELAPVERTFRLGLVDGVTTYNVINTSLDATADWFEVSDHADAEGMGTPGLELHSLEGMLFATHGGLDEFVYLPYLPRFDGVARAQVLNRRDEVALVAFNPDTVISRSRVNGRTSRGQIIRGDVYELEEVT